MPPSRSPLTPSETCSELRALLEPAGDVRLDSWRNPNGHAFVVELVRSGGRVLRVIVEGAKSSQAAELGALAAVRSLTGV